VRKPELLAKTLVLAIFAMSLDLLVGFAGLVAAHEHGGKAGFSPRRSPSQRRGLG